MNLRGLVYEISFLLMLQIKELFINDHKEVFKIHLPNKEERRAFFEDLIVNQAAKPPASKNSAGEGILHIKLCYL